MPQRAQDLSAPSAIPAAASMPGLFKGISLAVPTLETIQIRSIAPTEITLGAVDPRIQTCYLDNKFDQAPKSREEADARNVKGFNALQSSCTGFEINMRDSENGSAILDLSPSRYLLGEAYRKLVASGTLSEADQLALHPRFLNVSAIAIVRHEGQYHLLAQVKGKALGGAQLHPALVAGGVEAKYLIEADPLRAALLGQTKEETGLTQDQLRTSPWVSIVDERSLGFVNVVSCALNTDFSTVAGQFERSMTKRLQAGAQLDQLEAKGIANLPIAGLSLVPLEKGPGFQSPHCLIVTENGKLVANSDPRLVRPMFAPIARLLSQQGSLHRLIEASGW